MSVQQDSRYLVSWYGRYLDCGSPHSVHGPDGRIVDAFRSKSAAEYAARQLNAGLARVNPHAITGCKVEAA